MSQIRDKKAHRKHIATMNPINAKSVQLIELHAFAYCLWGSWLLYVFYGLFYLLFATCLRQDKKVDNVVLNHTYTY